MERAEPIPSSLDAPFWEAAAEGRLVLPVNPATGRASWFPRGEAEWQTSGGTGTVVTFTVVHRSFYSDLPAPYVIVVVRLAEGILMTGTLPGEMADRVRIGARVRVRFDPVGKQQVPGFDLAEAP
jgi:uncharacterized OB-fold protein